MNLEGPAVAASGVLGRVIEIVARTEQLEPGEIGPEARLEQDLGMDSLSRVELQMALEDEFGIQLADDQAASLCTIREVAEAISRARGGGALA